MSDLEGRMDGYCLHGISSDRDCPRCGEGASVPQTSKPANASGAAPRTAAGRDSVPILARMLRGTDVCSQGHRPGNEHVHFEVVRGYAADLNRLRQSEAASAAGPDHFVGDDCTEDDTAHFAFLESAAGAAAAPALLPETYTTDGKPYNGPPLRRNPPALPPFPIDVERLALALIEAEDNGEFGPGYVPLRAANAIAAAYNAPAESRPEDGG